MTYEVSPNGMNIPAIHADRPAAGLRVALFSGNYNCVRDGANKALNRLVQYLLDQGAAVRVYSPTIDLPAFVPAGDLVSVRSVAIPGRPEYRVAMGLPAETRADIKEFAPNLIHLSAPDILGVRAQAFAREIGVPVVSSLHTRFETYCDYYGIGFLRPVVEWHLRRFYRRSDYVLAPNEPLAQGLRDWGLPDDRARIWSRGVNRELFSPMHRDIEWRRRQGFADDDVVPLFFGRLVLEKGLDIFEQVIDALRARGHRVRPLIVGAGPAGQALADRIGEAVFTGHLEGNALSRAVASADILINPSVTEAFGNVNLEAMACGLAVVSADVASASSLIEDGRSGVLVSPLDVNAYVDATERLMLSPMKRLGLGRAAAEASQAYDWGRIFEEVLDVYRLARNTTSGSDDAPRLVAREAKTGGWLSSAGAARAA